MKRPLVAAVIAISALGVGGGVLAHTLQYRAEPVGANEFPLPIETDGEGTFSLKLSSDGMSARFDLKIKEALTDITQSHLHVGAPGSNGPIVVWLYPSAPPAVPIPGETDGRLAKGVFTEANLVGPLAGDWDGFVAALRAGNIYVNVHTMANPGGEIRDQVHAHGGGHDD